MSTVQLFFCAERIIHSLICRWSCYGPRDSITSPANVTPWEHCHWSHKGPHYSMASKLAVVGDNPPPPGQRGLQCPSSSPAIIDQQGWHPGQRGCHCERVMAATVRLGDHLRTDHRLGIGEVLNGLVCDTGWKRGARRMGDDAAWLSSWTMWLPQQMGGCSKHQIWASLLEHGGVHGRSASAR